jgi:hypothetical protein
MHLTIAYQNLTAESAAALLLDADEVSIQAIALVIAPGRANIITWIPGCQ